MTQEHPITPPPELIAKWAASMCGHYEAARWGSDQELEACCEWFVRDWTDIETADKLRAARRPTSPLSLKEEAIDTLHLIRDHLPADMYEKSFLIRRALESLPD